MRFLAVALLTLSACAVEALETIPQPLETTTTMTPTTTTSTTTTTTTIPEPFDGAECGEWHEEAKRQGWAEDDLERLDLILYRESRCLPDAHNPTDPHSGSYGLAQINGFWCRPMRYNPSGWLQAQGLLSTCDDLYDPAINLAAARAIYEYADAKGCGWSPWATKGARWCS